MRFRTAHPSDAPRVAALHADSWRRHYRGAYSDAFLDGNVESERHAAWSSRLAEPPGPSATILAEEDTLLVGFAHVILDHDPRWGSLVDNLHVLHDRRRGGIGSRLLGLAARTVTERASSPAMYLWVLHRNEPAQRFYRAAGATHTETAVVTPPAEDPERLAGTQYKLRMAWPDATVLSTLPASDTPR